METCIHEKESVDVTKDSPADLYVDYALTEDGYKVTLTRESTGEVLVTMQVTYHNVPCTAPQIVCYMNQCIECQANRLNT